MPSRESVVAALKAMNKGVDWDAPDAPQRYSSSLWNENDRGVIILNGSTMEALLEREVKKQMPHLNSDEITYFFGFNGPIGTFSSKIRMANALGLISRQIYKKMDLVREMRNTCAHSRQTISFQNEVIFDATICLIHDLRIAVPDKADNSAIRNTFMIACIFLMMTVVTGSADTAHDDLVRILKKVVRPSPEKPAE